MRAEIARRSRRCREATYGRVFLGGRAAGRPPAVAAQASKRPLLGWRMMEADRLTSIRSFVHREVAKLQTWQGFGAEGEPRPPRTRRARHDAASLTPY